MGELIALFVALPLLAITLYFMTGSFWPQNASLQVWLWLLGSGFVGFVFGDYCLFHAYAQSRSWEP